MQRARLAVNARLGLPGRLVLMTGLVFALVVGVLSMHTLSADSSGHAPTAMAHGQAATSHADASAEAAAPTTGHGASAPVQGPVEGPGPDRGHADMLTLCVLALLAGLLLLLPPAVLLISRSANPFRAPALHPFRAAPPPRPPSLILLSISRT